MLVNSLDDKVSFIPEFLAGGGEMGQLIRSHNWSATTLGKVERWPQSLRSALSICLNSNFPIAIYWGKELSLLYNDAWSSIPGNKHPWALGRPAKEVWPEIWDAIEPQFEKAFAGEPGGSKDALLLMQRHGYTEECYFDFTFTPVYGEGGKVEGVFNAVIETTYRVINERRTSFLKNLAIHLATAQSENELFGQSIRFMKDDSTDATFAIFYTVQNSKAILAGSTLSDQVHFSEKQPWPLEELVRSGQSVNIKNLGDYIGQIPKGFWGEECKEGFVVPFKNTKATIIGFWVFGLNPRHRFDADYKLFFENIVNTISAILSNITSLEEERKRVEVLGAVDKAKTAFFTNISHEFRTPLTLILGSLEGLLTRSNEEISRENKDALEASHRNALRLLRLVNNLLDFNRIEAGKVNAQFQLTDLARYTADLAANFRSVIENAGLSFRIVADTIIQPVYIDKEMWEKIVLNLLSNAFKYTLEGSISISLTTGNKQVLLKITDTGTGIPETELPKIFQRFYRVQNIAGRSYEGTGIGLSLVNELVRLLGGEITVISKEGAGTEFTVAIPIGKNHLPPGQVIEKELDFTTALSETFIEESTALMEYSFSEKEISALPPQGKEKTILVVDDNADLRTYIKNLLTKHYYIVTANNGMDALLKIKNNSPDLILSDIMMPIMDGTELLKAIKDNPATNSIPVILLSARAGEDSKIEGYDMGADDYLVKPFSAKELVARVHSQIKMAHTRKHIEQQLKNTFLKAPTGICVLRGPDYVVEIANEKMLALWGKTTVQMLNKPIFKAMPDAAGQGFESLLDKVYATGEPYVVNEMSVDLIRRGEMEKVYVKFVYAPLREENGAISGIIAVADEITDLVKARQKIEESEDRFRTLAETLPQLVWITNEKGEQNYTSRRWKEYTGIEPTGAESWQQILHPDDVPGITKAWRESMSSGKLYRSEARLKNKEGKYRWHFVQGEPIKNNEGDIIKWIGAFTDIHDQKTIAERLEQLVADRTKELIKSNEDLEQFAHVASHDLKEPLRKVKTFGNRLKTEFENSLPGKAKTYIEKMESATRKMDSMIDGVLFYSSMRAKEQVAEKVNLNTVISNIENDLEILIQQKNAFIKYKNLPVIEASPFLIHQLFYNLLSNSLKFAKADTSSIVVISSKIISGAEVKNKINSAKGEMFVEIAVKDNGIGFNQEDAEKIFKPFTRLNSKDKYEGTGLGLALCKKIAERHNGTIYAEENKEGGAAFYVLLPVLKISSQADLPFS